jgi:hypothetical protein
LVQDAAAADGGFAGQSFVAGGGTAVGGPAESKGAEWEPTMNEVCDSRAAVEREFQRVGGEVLAAVDEGLQALDRLVVAAMAGEETCCRFLLGLYSGRMLPLTLTAVAELAWPVRRDLAAVLLAFGEPGFNEQAIQEAFVKRGGFGWFIARVVELEDCAMEV